MQALLSRLRVAGPVLLGSEVESQRLARAGAPAAVEAAEWASAIAASVRRSLRNDQIWLAIVAFSTVFPTLDEHRAVRRALALAGPGDELDALLTSLRAVIDRATSLDAPLVLARNAVVIDANFAGRFDHNTGVQRVLRETVSRWAVEHPLVLTAWNDDSTALRALVGRERDRVLDWPTHSRRSAAGPRPDADAEVGASAGASADLDLVPASLGGAGAAIVVPVDSVVVEIEVAQVDTAAALAGLAAISGNRVALVGHDTIPIVSAQSQDGGEIERFARFLTVVKHSSRLAGVSQSAADEFSGFVSALTAQGVTGPDVVTVPLAMNAPSLATAPALAAASSTSRISGSKTTAAAAPGFAESPAGGNGSAGPLIVVVGSQEPRKNHSAILFAAERLWLNGEDFRLRFIGGGGALHLKQFDAEITRLQREGHSVEVLRGAGDQVLVDSYRDARFTIFPSLHEGFGLPVAESLALGTPVITADHGSLAEAARGGGCLMVDARDDEALAVAMTTLLHDDEVYGRLRAEAAARSFRTWDDYARELWAALIEPLVTVPSSAGALATDPLRADAPGADPAGAGTETRPFASTPKRASTAPVESQRAYDRLTLERWWSAANAAVAERQARERSILRTVAKIGPLARFFVARSREMGVPAASKAAFRVVKRRLISS
ncbi:glycosyltransferase [Subtercola endophyticus]|uniref:glycosyltransferase n=1 Tax=Subtercola endophyticus TaxID=2895559 RepID=UPI001E5DA257|nr:glycosyltransferase [Subtercola endophyticus]UFS57746.1 glycosyltransferase [Subtercola endophyticus]